MSSDITYVYINLEDREFKNSYMLNLCKFNNINVNRFNGIKLIKDKIPNSYINRLSPSYKGAINPNNLLGLFGCYLSHYNILKQYNINKHLCIMEDDILFDKTTIEKIKILLKDKFFKNNWDIIRIIWNTDIDTYNKSIGLIYKINNIKIYKYLRTNKSSKHHPDVNSKKTVKNDIWGGTHMYIVNYKNINKIISYLDNEYIFDIDGILSTNKLNIYCIKNSDMNVVSNIFNTSDTKL